MNYSFYIAGTDTDVGKTFCASALLHLAQRNELSCLGIKPIAAGCEAKDTSAEGEPRNLDALTLMRFSSIKLPYHQVNPVALSAFVSPHIAAAKEDKKISVQALLDACRPGLEQGAQFTLVEGAGGWYVPLNELETLAEFAAELKFPVILVVGLKLGCINHSLLTAEAIERSGLTMAGWIANSVDPLMEEKDQNIATLTKRLKAPCLGIVPHVNSVEDAADHLDLSLLLR